MKKESKRSSHTLPLFEGRRTKNEERRTKDRNPRPRNHQLCPQANINRARLRKRLDRLVSQLGDLDDLAAELGSNNADNGVELRDDISDKGHHLGLDNFFNSNVFDDIVDVDDEAEDGSEGGGERVDGVREERDGGDVTREEGSGEASGGSGESGDVGLGDGALESRKDLDEVDVGEGAVDRGEERRALGGEEAVHIEQAEVGAGNVSKRATLDKRGGATKGRTGNTGENVALDNAGNVGNRTQSSLRGTGDHTESTGSQTLSSNGNTANQVNSSARSGTDPVLGSASRSLDHGEDGALLDSSSDIDGSKQVRDLVVGHIGDSSNRASEHGGLNSVDLVQGSIEVDLVEDIALEDLLDGDELRVGESRDLGERTLEVEHLVEWQARGNARHEGEARSDARDGLTRSAEQLGTLEVEQPVEVDVRSDAGNSVFNVAEKLGTLDTGRALSRSACGCSSVGLGGGGSTDVGGGGSGGTGVRRGVGAGVGAGVRGGSSGSVGLHADDSASKQRDVSDRLDGRNESADANGGDTGHESVHIGDGVDGDEQSHRSRDLDDGLEDGLDTSDLEDLSDNVDAELVDVSTELGGTLDVGDGASTTVNSSGERSEALDLDESLDKEADVLEVREEHKQLRSSINGEHSSKNAGNVSDVVDDLEDLLGSERHEDVGAEHSIDAESAKKVDQGRDTADVGRDEQVGDSLKVDGEVPALNRDSGIGMDGLAQAVEVDLGGRERVLDLVKQTLSLGDGVLVTLGPEDGVSELGLVLERSGQSVDDTGHLLEVDLGGDVDSAAGGEGKAVLSVELDLGEVDSVDVGGAVLDAEHIVLGVRDGVNRDRVGHGERGKDEDERGRKTHRDSVKGGFD